MASYKYGFSSTVVLLLSCLLHVLFCFIRYNFRDNSRFCERCSILSGSWWCGHCCSYYHHGHHHLCMSREKENKEKVSVASSSKELVTAFLLYTGKLSREKTFANFMILWLFVKVFSAKIVFFTNSRKLFPLKVSCYTVCRKSGQPFWIL